MTSPNSFANTPLPQQIVQITSVDPVGGTATAVTRQNSIVNINIRYHVGAVHYIPCVNEQWVVKKVGVSWGLDRKLPKNDNSLANVVDNPVQGLTQIGSSGTGSGPTIIEGSQTTINSNRLQLGPSTLYRDNNGVLESSIDDGTTWNQIQGGGSGGGPVSWSSITGKPTDFPTDWVDITSIPSTFPADWTAITGKPATFPPTLPTGAGGTNTFWCWDGTWKAPPGGAGPTEISIDNIPTGLINGTNTVYTFGAAATANIYVANSTNHTVEDLSNGVQNTLGFTGLSRPYGVAGDAAGAVYVADLSNNSVVKLSGGVQTTLPFTGLSGPLAVGLDNAGNVYVTNNTGNNVLKLSGTTQTTLPFTGLNAPNGMAVTGSGDVYVGNYGANLVVKLSGGVQTTVGFTGLAGPCGVALDGSGAVYVADHDNNRIVKLLGGVQTTLPFTGLSSPVGVSVASNGDVYVADQGNNRIVKLAGGVQTTVSFTGLSGPSGVAVVVPAAVPAFTLGTTMVYLNGIRQKLGADYTETDSSTITFVSAPHSGDVLEADFVVAGGRDSMITGEVPSGTANGTNPTFTTTQTFVPATTSVFRNGLREILNTGYTESGGNAIVFSTPPLSTDSVVVDYLIPA